MSTEPKGRETSGFRKPADDRNRSDMPKYDWTSRARCKNQTSVMFPKGHKDISYIQGAREMCANCTVRKNCLEYALEFPAADMHGVWAGLTSRQLAAEQKRRGVPPTRPTLSQMWGD